MVALLEEILQKLLLLPQKLPSLQALIGPPRWRWWEGAYLEQVELLLMPPENQSGVRLGVREEHEEQNQSRCFWD